MNRSRLLFLGLVFSAIAVPARAADPVSDADRVFVAEVSQGGMFEVMLGQVAADKGSTQDIRDQGNTEQHDHEIVGTKLKSIATTASIPLASDLNADFTTRLNGLKALSGPAFDRAYLAAMKDIHAKDGAAFAMEAKSGTNVPLRAFAAETHRIVERHIGELTAIPAAH